MADPDGYHNPTATPATKTHLAIFFTAIRNLRQPHILTTLIPLRRGAALASWRCTPEPNRPPAPVRVEPNRRILDQPDYGPSFDRTAQLLAYARDTRVITTLGTRHPHRHVCTPASLNPPPPRALDANVGAVAHTTPSGPSGKAQRRRQRRTGGGRRVTTRTALRSAVHPGPRRWPPRRAAKPVPPAAARPGRSDRRPGTSQTTPQANPRGPCRHPREGPNLKQHSRVRLTTYYTPLPRDNHRRHRQQGLQSIQGRRDRPLTSASRPSPSTARRPHFCSPGYSQGADAWPGTSPPRSATTEAIPANRLLGVALGRRPSQSPMASPPWEFPTPAWVSPACAPAASAPDHPRRGALICAPGTTSATCPRGSGHADDRPPRLAPGLRRSRRLQPAGWPPQPCPLIAPPQLPSPKFLIKQGLNYLEWKEMEGMNGNGHRKWNGQDEWNGGNARLWNRRDSID